MRESKYFDAIVNDQQQLAHIISKGSGDEIIRARLLMAGTQMQNMGLAMDLIEVLEKYQGIVTRRGI